MTAYLQHLERCLFVAVCLTAPEVIVKEVGVTEASGMVLSYCSSLLFSLRSLLTSAQISWSDSSDELSASLGFPSTYINNTQLMSHIHHSIALLVNHTHNKIQPHTSSSSAFATWWSCFLLRFFSRCDMIGCSR